jgi:hypothetical protein
MPMTFVDSEAQARIIRVESRIASVLVGSRDAAASKSVTVSRLGSAEE